MYRLILFLAVCAALIAEPVKKSPVDLLREGRMIEAQRILEQSDAPERYHLLLDALREPNAIEACFLYREISARFPGTDCDEFAQERLLQAAEMGIDISSLVLERAPSVEPGQWPDEPNASFEVERPLIASTQSSETPVESSAPVVPKSDAEQVVANAEILSSVNTPDSPIVSSPITPVPPAKPTVESKPAKSVTLDYSSVLPAKKDTGIVVSKSTPEKSLVKQPETSPKVEKKSESKIKPNPEPTRPHDIDDPSPDGWYVQVGAFGNHDNAQKLAARLRKDGYTVYLVPRDNLLQVRVGSYSTKEQGRSVGDKIKEDYDVPAVLVTVP